MPTSVRLRHGGHPRLTAEALAAIPVLALPERRAGWSQRLLALAGAIAALVLLFVTLIRPWYLRWGAAAEETRRALPGDEIAPAATHQETRAITINAPVDRVWPWLAQLGQNRGGFYSFDLLENLVGCQMPTVDVLRPDAQRWQLGDRLWMYPKEKAGGIGYITLRSYVPGRALGFGGRAIGTNSGPETGSWSMVIEPAGDNSTRLLVRGRGIVPATLLGAGFQRAIFEPVHFVMERRMMLGIKQLAERGSRTWFQNHVLVLLWVTCFGMMLVALGRVLRGVQLARSAGSLLAAALVFQLLTLAQPSVVMSACFVTALAMLLKWARAPLPA